MNESRTTFICGCPHSGTTLMANMFAAHPDVFIPLRETELFMREKGVRRRWFQMRLRWMLSRRRFFAEKTPKHVQHLQAIRSVVRHPRFVVLVRDGRDVAASFIKRFGDPTVGVERWITDNRIVLQERDATDVHLVRYEDLVRAPEQHLRAVFEFAGIPFDAAVLRYHETPRHWFGETAIKRGTGLAGSEHRALRNWQVNQPIFDDSGKWKSLLSKEQAAVFERGEARLLMQAFGYA